MTCPSLYSLPPHLSCPLLPSASLPPPPPSFPPPPQVLLAKHRFGMICAGRGESKAASQLLQLSQQLYSQQDNLHALALEAQVGLHMARWGNAEAWEGEGGGPVHGQARGVGEG